MKNPGSVFITGATSGIGRALALEYAAPGVVLGITGRRREKLKETGKMAEAAGAIVRAYPVDVSNHSDMEKAVLDFLSYLERNKTGPDLVVANAGRGSRSSHAFKPGEAGWLENELSVLDVNVVGVVRTLGLFLPVVRERGGGTLVAVGSVAGFRGLPGSVYSASKAAVKTMMDSWRLTYGREKNGPRFVTLCPGFVDSEITRRRGAARDRKLPFLISAEKSARLIRRALERKRTKTYIYPWIWRPVVFLVRRIPDWLMPGKW